MQRRLADYQPFLAAGDYSPVRTAAENDWLSLQAVERNWHQLRNQEIIRMRFR